MRPALSAVFALPLAVLTAIPLAAQDAAEAQATAGYVARIAAVDDAGPELNAYATMPLEKQIG